MPARTPTRSANGSWPDAGHLTHAFAITGHKAQGLTVDRAWVLADDQVYREWGYVALSRARASTAIYLVEPDQDPADQAHVPATARRRPQAPDPRREPAALQGQDLAHDTPTPP